MDGGIGEVGGGAGWRWGGGWCELKPKRDRDRGGDKERGSRTWGQVYELHLKRDSAEAGLVVQVSRNSRQGTSSGSEGLDLSEGLLHFARSEWRIVRNCKI